MFIRDKVKKLGIDFILNLCAGLIVIATLQLLVYPQLAKALETESYGRLLTLMGLVATLTATFGNGLNNLRLIVHKDYSINKLYGDFNVLLICAVVVNIIVCVFIFLFFGVNSIEFCLLTILAVLMIIRIYNSVDYRLHLNYKNILLMNLCLSIGYVFGFYCLLFFEVVSSWWAGLFALGEVIALCFLYRTTGLFREPLVRTGKFKETVRKYGSLIYLTFTANVLLYLDRNLLFPLIGGTAVAVYFAATVVGKALSTLTGPLGTVLLSHFSQIDFEMTRKKFWKINTAIVCIGIASYIVSILVADVVLKNLYPSLYGQAKPFLNIASVIPVLRIIGSMADPAVLRFVSLSKQSVWQTLYLLVSALTSYFAAKYNGLWGFCYAAIFLNVLRIIMLWWLGNTVLKDNID